MRRKVLVFNGYYIPAKKYGGPTTSLAAIVDNCSDDYEFYIVAANHDLNETEIFPNIHNGWNDVGKAKVLYIDLVTINYKPKKIRELLNEVKPDLVWLVGILVPADKWFIAKECRELSIPYIVSPRGEVCENTFHMKYMKKKIVSKIAQTLGVYKNAWYHATSEEERDGLIKYYGARKDRIFLVPNIAANRSVEESTITKNLGDIRIAFISRIQRKKNLLTAIKSVNLLHDGKVKFDIYGPMEEDDYWRICQEEILKSPKNVKIEYCGSLAPEEVSNTFRNYHCFLFPTLSENYGHVIVEALSVCCPIVLSRGTTPWDDIEGRAGYTVDNQDIQEYCKVLNEIRLFDNDRFSELTTGVKKYYIEKVLSDDAVKKHKMMLQESIGMK